MGVDSNYDFRLGASGFGSIINVRHLLSSDLATFDVRFIQRQVDEVSYILIRVVPCHVGFHIFI